MDVTFRPALAPGHRGVVPWSRWSLQFALVLDGAQVLVEEDAPTMAESIYRFFAYFTIQSNLLVAATSRCSCATPPATTDGCA